VVTYPMHYAYVLQSTQDQKLYIGYTDNLKRRFTEHNSKKNFSTKSRAPFKLLFYEALPTKEEALQREKFYKSGRGHEVLYKILFKSLPR
jgi:putative endonuclease